MNHTLEFRPQDVLFFRDGRPMAGSARGDGSHFPNPHILHAALHAALHRAFPDPKSGGHVHRRVKRNRRSSYTPRAERVADAERVVRFGALQSVGPFPAIRQSSDGPLTVAFPAPGNVLLEPTGKPGDPATPVIASRPHFIPGESSLPPGQTRAPVSTLPPAKRKAARWITREGFETWLADDKDELPPGSVLGDDDFFDSESTIGIAIDPNTGTTLQSQFYSKNQMRLRPEAALVAFASMHSHRHNNDDDAILERLFPETRHIFIGGERRVCEVVLHPERSIDSVLPTGAAIKGKFVKWVLLSPAIFPWLPANNHRTTPHPGGWLPSWVHSESLEVELLDGPGKRKADRLGIEPGKPIGARLVTAQVARPEIITGWSNHADNRHDEIDTSNLGARSTLLAVPAGSIYYFEAETPDDAKKLAEALNWHGSQSNPSNVVNRRSTLFGEKGFGIGVCGPWAGKGQEVAK